MLNFIQVSFCFLLFFAVATFTASRRHSPTTIFTAMMKYFTAIIKYSMYARTCTLLLTYPTQTPLLFSGSRLDRQCFPRFMCPVCSGGFGGRQPPKRKTIEFILSNLCGYVYGSP